MKRYDDNYKLIFCWLAICVTIILLALFGCTTVKQSESTIDHHYMESILHRTDSLIHATATWQQTIYTQQTSLVDSFKSREVRDTSHTYFLGAQGDTIKEKIIIKEYIEREHSSQESTETYWEERFHQTDSLLRLSLEKQNRTDSLIQSYQKTAVVEKETPWYRKLWYNIRAVIYTIIALVVFLILYKLGIFIAKK